MYITNSNLIKVLEWFYNQEDYELMLMFVSGLEYKYKNILKGIADNAYRINRITGNELCYIYFVELEADSKVKGEYVLNNYEAFICFEHWRLDKKLHDAGDDAAAVVSEEICNHFGILRSDLPAFLLISKDRKFKGVFSVKRYEDLELFLTPINIINDYLSDRRNLNRQYEADVKRLERKFRKIERRRIHRESLQQEINRLKQKKENASSLGLADDDNLIESEIKILEYKLEQRPEFVCRENIEELGKRFADEIKAIEERCSNKLNLALFSQDGEKILNQCGTETSQRSKIIKNIWNQISTKNIRISREIQIIRERSQETGFDVFISCKSEDYDLAEEVKKYLEENGFKPFLASKSLQEIGISKFSSVIWEVLDQCKNLITFATQSDYLKSSYVFHEWSHFHNNIVTEKMPGSQICNILAPTINLKTLPPQLYDYQSFTIDNYKDGLIDYLRYGKRKK